MLKVCYNFKPRWMYPICPKTSILWFWKFDKFILDHCINGEKMVKVRDIYIETKKADQGK